MNSFNQMLLETPPLNAEAFDQFVSKSSDMTLTPMPQTRGLGQTDPTVPAAPSWFSGDWVTPVVIIVVSAMALMTVYALLREH